MATEEEQECPPCPAGIPGWVMTFADLMSLLMCFFVLLLSFSEMDALKFKRLAEELRDAFGVQTVVNAAQQQEAQGNQGKQTRILVQADAAAQNKATEDNALQVANLLENEIAQGQIEIETVGQKIIIRIQQRGAFRSGSDYIEDRFLPVIDKIRTVLVTIPGLISVEGHTDDVPVSGGRFRSNWSLSTARAVAFAEELFAAPEMDASRFQVVGHGSTQPLVENLDSASRARNRRVEIIILRSRENDTDNQPEIEPDMKQIDNAVNAVPEDFELRPNEIF